LHETNQIERRFVEPLIHHPGYTVASQTNTQPSVISEGFPGQAGMMLAVNIPR
jgi:hypothetical protein